MVIGGHWTQFCAIRLLRITSGITATENTRSGYIVVDTRETKPREPPALEAVPWLAQAARTCSYNPTNTVTELGSAPRADGATIT